MTFVFKNKNVRIMDQNGEPWFVLIDVCKCLDIDNARNVRARLEEDEVSTVDVIDALGRTQHVTAISETRKRKTRRK